MTDYLGLFSVESRRKDLMRLKPNTFYDIAEYHALYNHEVCKDIELYIKRRHHHIGAEYVIPDMRKYLGSTYGILLYQEQMMMLSRLLADFTREESYELIRRRSDELKAVFLERGEEDGQDPQTLSDIWAEWERKGPYLMSKSQAYDYAFMVYQIAYLRTHYPIEFQMEFPWNSEFRLRIF
jgi:DNA polymerase-3 subunit alpha